MKVVTELDRDGQLCPSKICNPTTIPQERPMEFRAGYDKNFSLNGKVALITVPKEGSARAIATLFYEKGANLILLDLNPNIQNVGQEICSRPETIADRRRRYHRGRSG